jgi:prepilin-type N-terminal cleavage/methylation domain-containing protein
MSNRRAFTLIELLMVLVILSVMAGIALPNFSNTFKKLELTRTADDISILIRWAQAKAISEQINYQFVFIENDRAYQILREDDPELNKNNPTFRPASGRLGRKLHLPRSVQVKDAKPVRIYSNGSLEKVRFYLENKTGRLMLSSMEHRGVLFILEVGNGA